MKKIVSLFFILIFSSTTVFAADPLVSKQNYYDGSSRSFNSGKGVIIAIIDEGIWQEHPDLKGSEWINQKETQSNNLDDDGNGFVDDYFGYNFIDNNGDMTPKGGHATNVAGVIGARMDNGIGIQGLAPNAKLMNLIACDSFGCPIKAVQNAIRYAVDNGATVINLSLGGSGYVGYSDSYNDVIQYAYDKNVVVVASAGNGDTEAEGQLGQNTDFLKVSPVSNDVNGINTVLGVGATIAFSSDKTTWTNYGSFVDVYTKGSNVATTANPKYSDGYGYDSVSGTSFAAPIISADVAFLQGQYPKLKNYEIIDIIVSANGSQNFLALSNQVTKRNCSIDSVPQQTFTATDKITIKGQGFRKSDSFSFVQYKDSVVSNRVYIDEAIKILDAKTLVVDLSKLKITDGIHVLQNNTGDCSVKNFTLQVTNSINNNQNQAPLLVKNYLFTKDLSLGAIDKDVKFLQIFLNKKGFTIAKNGIGSKGKEVSNFGKGTKSALIRFQVSQKIQPANGILNEQTRKIINSL